MLSQCTNLFIKWSVCRRLNLQEVVFVKLLQVHSHFSYNTSANEKQLPGLMNLGILSHPTTTTFTAYRVNLKRNKFMYLFETISSLTFITYRASEYT